MIAAVVFPLFYVVQHEKVFQCRLGTARRGKIVTLQIGG
ncbi:MAG: hypothetical protein A4E62_02995 [Syntrophorhabdus sp. PtaU1.Bin002]|nr:MAG: hypothetical protein A4E62_02995 [Syntrophorhabdus sp. PtaU1.Bin002]